MKKILLLTFVLPTPVYADYADIFTHQQSLVNSQATYNSAMKDYNRINKRRQGHGNPETPINIDIVPGTRTVFNDGWVSTAQTNWVTVVKDNTAVLLHKSFPFTDELRRNIPLACWNQVAWSRYDGLAFYPKPKSEFYGNPYDFLQVDAIDKGTGQRVFLSFLLIANNGIVNCIEAINATPNEFMQYFPTMNSLLAMSSYLPRN
ncbi:MAG: hypothetical protein ABL933_02790 [Methyloglobulus sp.]|nr:hypothetical protein [Methyloglobulus sp.]